MGVVYGFSREKGEKQSLREMDRLYGITTHQSKGSKFFPKYRGLGVGVGFMTKSNYGHGVSWRFATFRTISRTPGMNYAQTKYRRNSPHLSMVCCGSVGGAMGIVCTIGVKTSAIYQDWQRCTYRGRLCEKCILWDRAKVGR